MTSSAAQVNNVVVSKGPRAMINKISARCEICRASVPAGKGLSWKGPRGWVSCCATSACVEAAGVQPPTPAATRRVITKDGAVVTPYEPQNLGLLRSFPGAKFVREPTPHWQVSLLAQDRTRVLELANRLSLEIAPELLETPELPASVQAAAERARAAGAYEFQVQGVEAIAGRRSYFLADDQGLGKTLQALMIVGRDEEGAPDRAIVVAPANVKFNWLAEVRKWRPDLSARAVSGKQKDLSAIIPVAGEVVVINYDILPADLGAARYQLKFPRREDLVEALNLDGAAQEALSRTQLIVDEAHRAKNYKALRSQRLTTLSQLCGYRLGMSGTPLPNRPFDLFGTLSALDMAFEVFGSFNKFVETFNGRRGRFGIEWPDYSATPMSGAAAEMLRKLMLRREKAQVLPQLPAKTYRELKVAIGSKALAKDLDKLEEQWGDLLAMKSLPPFEEISAVRARLASSRCEAAVELVEDYEEAGRPLLVFSAHREPVELIGARDGWRVIAGGVSAEDRVRIVEEFQAGKLKGVALTIKAGCEGLTLTHASDALFVDLDWTPALNRQAEDRCHRIGQKSNVVITRMVSDHPVDLLVQDLLVSKAAMAEQALNGVLEAKPATVVPNAPRLEIVQETVEEMEARRAENDALLAQNRASRANADDNEWDRELSRDEVKARAQVLRDRHVAAEDKRAHIWEQAITETNREAVSEAYRYLISVCDGAQEKDGSGFNKPDAAVTQMFSPHFSDDDCVRATWALILKYKKQLRSALDAAHFKALFDR